VSADHSLLGKVGRVTGKIEPGKMGEVMLPVRGGSEAFYAYAADDLVIPEGARVAVVEYEPPRTVVVTPIE
jgi:hypothetical protein